MAFNFLQTGMSGYGGQNSFVATPEQDAESERVARMLGLWTPDNPHGPQVYDAPVNVMQPPQMPAPPAMEQVAQQMPAPARELRKRGSIVDAIGELADVFAKIGGAEPMYNLEAQQDREMSLEDRRRAIELNNLKFQAAKGELGDQGNARLGQAFRGLQAIQSANPNADVSQVWPLLAKQAGIDDARIAELGAAIAENPELIKGLAAGTGAAPEYTGQIVYATGPDGKLRAFQPSKDGSGTRDILPEGYTPADPLKFVDLGGGVAPVASRTGQRVAPIMPKSEKPGAVADRTQRGVIARDRNRTTIQVAGMPARAKAAGGGKAAPNLAAVAESARPIVADLKDAITRLNKSGGMTGKNSGVLDTLGATARENVPGFERFTNKEGFSARQDLDRLLTTGIPALLPLLGGLQLGGKNIDAAKELDTWRKAIASAKDYPSAMRAIKGFEDRITFLTKNGTAAAPATAAPNAAALAEARRRGLIK